MEKSNIIVDVTDQVIDVTLLISQMKDPGAGALSIFLGTTRDNFEDKTVVELEYEAHPSMAKKKLVEIAEYCIEKYELLKMALVHRIGVVVCSFLCNLACHRG